MPEKDFTNIFKSFFPLKTPGRIRACLAKLGEAHPGGVPLRDGKVYYQLLFAEDREFNQVAVVWAWSCRGL